MWEPANGYYTKGAGAKKGASQLLEGAREDLAAEVGEIYQQAVMDCICGLRPKLSCHKKQGDKKPGDYEGIHREDPEQGIESDFLWRVVRQLENLESLMMLEL
ncbi:hypothetical protein N7478_009619 [Penicillium angulare]|uniref:uncharacterized protein n=1 Tax=Penicillium angulare TaxID=116970 RepID=UPI00254015AC|nr:uncharacterized protein N7478_009619 [Penicillium angulare]KAJ5266811.1 hypothetical protein N7478_009619 [Penicillium angulare]